MKSISFSSYKTTSITTSVVMQPQKADLQRATLLSLSERPRTYQGYMHGFKQPSGHIKLHVISFHATQIENLFQALTYYFHSVKFEIAPINSEYDLALRVAECISAMQKAAGFPIFEPVQINIVPEVHHTFSLWIPMLYDECFHHAAAFMLQFFNHHLAIAQWEPDEKIAQEFNGLIEILKSYSPMGTNSVRQLLAAHLKDIHWLHVGQNTFQYGHGHHSRWFDSTFTEETAHISVHLAKDKQGTIKLLRRAGLPVPEQKIVTSEEEAVKFANAIGYPVVIKPNNQDGGIGVSARIISAEKVKEAYLLARQHSSIVLLEKHVMGKDYRLLILHGKLFWAIERIPAGVTGDGSSTISELIQKENQRPERSENKNYVLKTIDITQDLTDFLGEQGYSLDTILEPEQFVAVTRIANIAAGGTPVAVFDKVHPDNKRLAETAAKALRLDIAGVDFISPDIQQSYKKTGGAVIEVNGQPQFGIVTDPHIYERLLAALLPHQGRIPLIVVCGNTSVSETVEQISTQLAAKYKNIGMVKNNCAYLNNEVFHNAASSFHAAEALLINKEVEVLVYCINTCDDIQQHGLPFHYYDCLVYLDAPVFKAGMLRQQQNNLLNMVFKACKGRYMVFEKAREDLSRKVRLQDFELENYSDLLFAGFTVK